MHRLALLLCALVVAAGLQADERILDYHSEIQVQPDGALHVTETIRVRAEGRAIRRGIYRDFPTRYTDRIGNRVVVDFTPVSVRRDGGSEPWHTERLRNGVRIYAGSANTLIEPGIHVYEFVDPAAAGALVGVTYFSYGDGEGHEIQAYEFRPSEVGAYVIHLENLHQRGDHSDVADESEETQVHAGQAGPRQRTVGQQVIEDQVIDGNRDHLDHDHGNAEANRGFDLL